MKLWMSSNEWNWLEGLSGSSGLPGGLLRRCRRPKRRLRRLFILLFLLIPATIDQRIERHGIAVNNGLTGYRRHYRRRRHRRHNAVTAVSLGAQFSEHPRRSWRWSHTVPRSTGNGTLTLVVEWRRRKLHVLVTFEFNIYPFQSPTW